MTSLRRKFMLAVMALVTLSFTGMLYYTHKGSLKSAGILQFSDELLMVKESSVVKRNVNISANKTWVHVQRMSSIDSGEPSTKTKHMGPKRILFYNDLTYGKPSFIYTNSKSFFKKCEINKCTMDFDRKLVNTSDAVLSNSIKELNLRYKQPGQIWIMIQWESLHMHMERAPPNAPIYLRNKVNWTVGLSKNADIYVPYGKPRMVPQEKRPRRNYAEIAKSKTRDAVWVVSHCRTPSKREMYVDILKKYISVDILGKCGKKRNCGLRNVHDRCFDILNTTYRYYLAFENSLCQDYITEKFFDNYKYDIIQVVRGGDKYNRPINMSKQAYINANDFGNAHELGKFLRKLSTDPEAYASMLRTKDDYEIVPYMDLFADASCEICKRLHNVDKYTSVYDDPYRWLQETQPCYEPYDL